MKAVPRTEHDDMRIKRGIRMLLDPDTIFTMQAIRETRMINSEEIQALRQGEGLYDIQDELETLRDIRHKQGHGKSAKIRLANRLEREAAALRLQVELDD